MGIWRSRASEEPVLACSFPQTSTLVFSIASAFEVSLQEDRHLDSLHPLAFRISEGFFPDFHYGPRPFITWLLFSVRPLLTFKELPEGGSPT